MISTLAQVALGGALGASARYLASVATMRLVGPGFPWATLAVNIAGSALMGALVVVLAQRDATRLAPFLVTGVLGGFTTFSAFSLEAFTLYERGQIVAAAAYVGLSVVLSLLGLALGVWLARGITA